MQTPYFVVDLDANTRTRTMYWHYASHTILLAQSYAMTAEDSTDTLAFTTTTPSATNTTTLIATSVGNVVAVERCNQLRFLSSCPVCLLFSLLYSLYLSFGPNNLYSGRSGLGQLLERIPEHPCLPTTLC